MYNDYVNISSRNVKAYVDSLGLQQIVHVTFYAVIIEAHELTKPQERQQQLASRSSPTKCGRPYKLRLSSETTIHPIRRDAALLSLADWNCYIIMEIRSSASRASLRHMRAQAEVRTISGYNLGNL